jgi:TetR/AcrR family transcriptional repressor of nem operon
MRYDAEHKERTRERVVNVAAAAIREHGPSGIGVADLMNKAGLTHGGFYAHFRSKDELVAEAIGHMFDERYETFRRCTEGKDPARGLEKYIDVYLSARHRDDPAQGCPMPILAGDLARLPAAAKARFQAGFDRIIQGTATLLAELGQSHPRATASSALAEMVGALALSRVVTDCDASDQLLRISRDAVKRRMGLKS